MFQEIHILFEKQKNCLVYKRRIYMSSPYSQACKGGDVNFFEFEGKTALIYTTENDHHDVVGAASQ